MAWNNGAANTSLRGGYGQSPERAREVAREVIDISQKALTELEAFLQSQRDHSLEAFNAARPNTVYLTPDDYSME